MPFEAFEDHVGLLNEDTPAEYKPTGITLASARTALTDHMETLRECVTEGKVPSEQLFKNVADAERDLYRFADRLENAFEAHIARGPPAVTRHILELRNGDGGLANITDAMQDQLRGYVRTMFTQFEENSRRIREASRRRREQLLQGDEEFLAQLGQDRDALDQAQRLIDAARARRETAAAEAPADAAEAPAPAPAEEEYESEETGLELNILGRRIDARRARRDAARAAAAEAAEAASDEEQEDDDEASAQLMQQLFGEPDSDDEH